MSEAHEAQLVRIVKTNPEEQVCYGVVYTPNVLDTWGEMMLPSDVKLMAHRYMQVAKLNETIDRQHDNVATKSYPIESFVARKGDPDYPEGAWVVGMKCDDDTWADVKSGKINGFSYQCLVRKVPAIVEVEVARNHVGETDAVEDHTHLFYAEIDENGVVVAGRTSEVNGHTHEIFGGTVTEKAEGHSHRFFV